MACDVLCMSHETNPMISQDLLIVDIDIFYNLTVLDLALKAAAHDFVCLIPVQQLLNDIWYDKLDPHLSSWKVFCCSFKPPKFTQIVI